MIVGGGSLKGKKLCHSLQIVVVVQTLKEGGEKRKNARGGHKWGKALCENIAGNGVCQGLKSVHKGQ